MQVVVRNGSSVLFICLANLRPQFVLNIRMLGKEVERASEGTRGCVGASQNESPASVEFSVSLSEDGVDDVRHLRQQLILR